MLLSLSLLAGLTAAPFRPDFDALAGPELILHPSVAGALGLTADDVDGLSRAFAVIRDRYTAEMGKAQALGDAKKVEALRQERDNKLDQAILERVTPTEYIRFRRMIFQVAGLKAFEMPGIRDSLKLTDKQMEQLPVYMRQLQKEVDDLLKESPKEEDEQASAYLEIQALRRKAVRRFVETLTPEQQKKWERMASEKIELKLERRPKDK
jgi:hypothetical protein